MTTSFVNSCTLLIEQMAKITINRNGNAIAYIIGIISICLHNQSITGNLDVKALTVRMTKKGEEECCQHFSEAEDTHRMTPLK